MELSQAQAMLLVLFIYFLSIGYRSIKRDATCVNDNVKSAQNLERNLLRDLKPNPECAAVLQPVRPVEQIGQTGLNRVFGSSFRLVSVWARNLVG